LKSKLLDFINKPFVRNIFILASGTATAQMVNMLFSPIITRLYGPEAYGLMGTFTAIVSILGPIAALTYPISMVLPKNDNDSALLAKLSFLLTIINTIIVTLFLIFFSDQIINIFNLESVAPFLYFIPFIVLSAGVLQILEQWMVRKKEFQVSAKASLIEAIVVNSGKLGIGLMSPVAAVLIFFTVFRQGFRAIIMGLFYGLSNIKKLFIFEKEDKEHVKKLAKKYKNFPMYRSPEVFLNAVSGNLPVLLLTSFFGPASAGFYSISRSVMTIPSRLIGKSIGDVFYPQATEAANNRKKIAPLLTKATFYLGLVAIPPFALVVLFGPWLFSLVFGEDWVIAGEYARWVAVWMFFAFINRPSVQTLPILSAQRFQLIFTIITLVLRMLALLLGFYVFRSDVVAIALFGIIGALSNIFLISASIYKSKNYDRNRNATQSKDLFSDEE